VKDPLPPSKLGAASDDEIVDVERRIKGAEAPGAEKCDGIRDALDPVRQLVGVLFVTGVYMIATAWRDHHRHSHLSERLMRHQPISDQSQ
jgi:hypothetical protein